METTVGAIKSKILQTDFRVFSENSTIYNIGVLQERKRDMRHDEKNKIKGKKRKKEKEKKEGRNPFKFQFIYFLCQEYLALI